MPACLKRAQCLWLDKLFLVFLHGDTSLLPSKMGTSKDLRIFKPTFLYSFLPPRGASLNKFCILRYPSHRHRLLPQKAQCRKMLAAAFAHQWLGASARDRLSSPIMLNCFLFPFWEKNISHRSCHSTRGSPTFPTAPLLIQHLRTSLASALSLAQSEAASAGHGHPPQQKAVGRSPKGTPAARGGKKWIYGAIRGCSPGSSASALRPPPSTSRRILWLKLLSHTTVNHTRVIYRLTCVVTSSPHPSHFLNLAKLSESCRTTSSRSYQPAEEQLPQAP